MIYIGILIGIGLCLLRGLAYNLGWRDCLTQRKRSGK